MPELRTLSHELSKMSSCNYTAQLAKKRPVAAPGRLALRRPPADGSPAAWLHWVAVGGSAWRHRPGAAWDLGTTSSALPPPSSPGEVHLVTEFNVGLKFQGDLIPPCGPT